MPESIDSILSQTFRDFELMIINDGSSDNSEEIIKSYNDSRIVYKKHSKNEGLIATLNEGIDQARGKYIIRMDADDVSMPRRFEKQVAFMEENSAYGLLGTWTQVMDSEEIYRPYIDDMTIRVEQLRLNQFIHTSVILRKSVLIEHQLYYSNDFYATEDYEFWVRVAACCKVANLDEVLVKYRKHAGQASSIHSKMQVENADRTRILQIELAVGIQLNPQERHYYLRFLQERPENDEELSIENNLLRKLLQLCKAKEKGTNFYYYLGKQFSKDLRLKTKRYLFNKFVIQPTRFSWKLLYDFFTFPISPARYMSFAETTAFIFKCLFFYKKSRSEKSRAGSNSLLHQT